MLSKSPALFAILTGILILSSVAHGQSPQVNTHVTRLGNEVPFSLFRTISGTVGPVTDSASGVYSDFFISADYGLLTVNTSAVLPANTTSQSASANAFAKWTDTFNFTPSDGLLVDSPAIARFSLSLFGTWTHDFDPSTSATSTSYDVQANGGDIAMGSFSVVSGGSGDLNIGDFSSFSFDQNFNIGTPFIVSLFLSDDFAIQNIPDGTSSSLAHLTLASTGMQVIDNSSTLIAGTMATDSGHDYSISSIPEPAAWAVAPLLAGMVAVWRRRRS